MRRRFMLQLYHGASGRSEQRRLEAIAGIMAKHGAYAEVRIRREDPDFVNYLTDAHQKTVTLVKIPNAGKFAGTPVGWDTQTTTDFIHEVIRRQAIAASKGATSARVEPLRQPEEPTHASFVRFADQMLDAAIKGDGRVFKATSRPSSAGNLRPVEEARKAPRRLTKTIKRR